MIIEELKQIVESEREKETPLLYLRNLLKEYLQIYLLHFIYTSSEHSRNFIFTGGTCLRHFFDLDRLSEDVDFDYLKTPDIARLKTDLEFFFSKKYKYSDVVVSVKQQGNQILLKFPVLKRLGLAREEDSDFLYVKMDVSPNPSSHYDLQTTSKSRYGFNFVATHYDLGSLMAGKLHAVLTRRHMKGKKNVEGLKGRDYYDLLWYLKRGVRPNLLRLSDMLGEKLSMESLRKRLDEKVAWVTTEQRSYFEADLFPLLKNAEVVPFYVRHYRAEYDLYKF